MSRARKPRLTSTSVTTPEGRWDAIDAFLRRTASLKPIRTRLTALLDQVRVLGDFGLAEDIEETLNELGGEPLDHAVLWAFEQGRIAGWREGSRN